MPIDVKANGVAQLLPPIGDAHYVRNGHYYNANGIEVATPKDAPAVHGAKSTARQSPRAAAVTPPAEPTGEEGGIGSPGGDAEPTGQVDASEVGTDGAGVPNYAAMGWQQLRKAHRERFGKGVAPGMSAADVRLALMQSHGDESDWN